MDTEESVTPFPNYAQDSATEQVNGMVLDQQPYPDSSNDATAASTQMVADDSTELGAADAPVQSEWDRYWGIVRTNPEDFTSWEYLVRLAEAAEGGVAAGSPDENITNMRLVYDQFLSKFPLCFGYWKKYADLEYAIDGIPGAERTFERGVSAISNSVDLWTQYCQFKMEHSQTDDEIRGVFERGAAAVGLDFLSHIFWDKYIEYEEKKEAFDRIVKILERIIRIPMHQYARFFERYQQLSATRPVKELLNPESYEEYEKEIRAQVPQPEQPMSENEDEPPSSAPTPEKSDEQVETEIRARIHQTSVDVYMRTQDETNKRWVFEAEIKRPYFHVKPMDEPQLSNWRRYLDFEEEANDEQRVQVLYERCLVACALHEEFWHRYGKWFQSKGRKLDALNVFARATSVFIPANRPSIRLACALLQEEQGQIEEAKKVYKGLLEAVPGHLETIVKYAHFERRQNSGTVAEIFTSNIESSLLDERAKAFLTVQYAKFLWHSESSVEKTRNIYYEAASKYQDSKYFWLNYLNFEMAQNDLAAEQHTAAVFELIRSNATISADVLRDINLRYADFLAERGTSVALLNSIESEVSAPSNTAAFQLATPGASKKRGAEEAYNPPTKQARFDSPAAQHAGVAVSPQAASQPYYPNQSTTQQYQQYPPAAGAQPYAYQYPQQYGAATAAAPAVPAAGAWDYAQSAGTTYQ